MRREIRERLLQLWFLQIWFMQMRGVAMSFHEESARPAGLDELEQRARNGNGCNPLPLRDWIALAEAWRISQALQETRGNQSAAARLLGHRTAHALLEDGEARPRADLGDFGQPSFRHHFRVRLIHHL